MSLQKCACGARREQPCRAAARVPTAASCPHSRPPLALTAAARARAAVLPHAHPGLPGLHGVWVCAPRQPVGVHAARRAAPAPGQTPHPMPGPYPYPSAAPRGLRAHAIACLPAHARRAAAPGPAARPSRSTCGDGELCARRPDMRGRAAVPVEQSRASKRLQEGACMP